MSIEDSTDLELEFIQLAVGNGQRKVRTPEGARFYGQPIGTIITAEMIRAKKREAKAQGITPPKGGLSKKPKAVTVATGKASPASNFNSSPAGPPKPGASKKSLGDAAFGKATPTPGIAADPKFQVKSPTIKGPNSFRVGDSSFTAPAGSKLIRPKNQPSVAYVYTPDGQVHAFTAAGEIDLDVYADGELKPVLEKKFKDLKSSDPLYKVEEFDAASGLVDQKPGAVLSKNGKPAFKKTESGTWLNEDLGIELTDDDLQPAFDSGKFDLETANTIEESDFSKMTQDELHSALESMPEGKQLAFGTGMTKAVLTKERGSWKSSLTGNSMDDATLADLAENTTLLSDKLDTPSGTPAEPAKAEKAEKDKKATDPLMNPENEISDANAQKQKAKSATVSGADVAKAKDGDVLYHDQLGALTKSKKQWNTTQGVSFPDSVVRDASNLGYLSKEPWDEKQASEKEEADLANKLVVNGKEVPTVAKFEENDRSEKIKADGGSTPPVFELEATPENAKLFVNAMKKSLEGNPYAASVYIYDEDNYAGMRLFLADDGKSGIALHDGDEIVSVFSDPKSKNKKVARHLISVAVENGGKRLDAFDTVLPSIYAKEGFTVQARLKWNDEYAPDGWDKETFSKFNNGEPDVVFMKHEPGLEDTEYEPGSGDYVEDYDAGLAATGGKAQDENDYRPESGDPDNDDSTVETTTNGWVVSEDVQKAVAEGKKITAIKALMSANPDKVEGNKGAITHAKQEIESFISDGIAPGTPFDNSMLWNLPKGSKFKTAAGVVFSKNENGNWVTPNGGVYTPAELAKSAPNGTTVFENPNYKEKAPKAATVDEDFDPDSDDFDFIPENPVKDEPFEPIPEGGVAVTDFPNIVPGDTVNLQTPDGTVVLKNIGNGEWEETKNGYIFTDEDVLWDADQGKVWMDADQAQAVQNNIETKANAESGVVKSLKGKFLPGDWITVGNVAFQKSLDGTWSENGNGTFPFKDSDFKVDLDAGNVKKGPKATTTEIERTFQKGTKDNPAYADEPIPAGAPKIVDETPSKGFKNTTQTQEAIDALESHSGFQIKYGLKSLPEDHPLKDQEFLDETVAKAKEQFPELPPKKALVKHLKFTLGQEEPLADWELELLESNEEKFQIGTRSPKDTATGVTGGAFKKADIEKAISILENYNGKLFKNELNKEGNPLGKLSPNNIVGFDKDKTVTKQKFIDLLKKKIEPKEAPEPQGPDNSDLDYSDTPETGKVVAANFEMSALANAPEGSHIEIANSIGDTSIYRKDADGRWYPQNNSALLPKDSDSVVFYNRAMQGKLKWADAPSEPESVKAPEVGEKVAYEQVAGLPVGTEITTPSGTIWTKIDNSKFSWQAESPNNGVGDTLYENVDLKPFTTSGNGTLQKLGDGTFDKPQKSNYAEAVETAAEQVPSLTKGDKITSMEQFKDLPVGTKLKYTPDTQFGAEDFHTYTKVSPGLWHSSLLDGDPAADPIEDKHFQNSIDKGSLEYDSNVRKPEVVDNGSLEINDSDTALDAAIDSHFQQIQELDKATSILPPEERGANGDGFVVVHTENGPKITWGKFGGGGIATVAVDENGVKKVLIGKRGDRDEWYLPGGAIDENETHLQGSLREFSEEVADGDAILDNIKITNAFQAVIGKIDGTDKDWKYVTSVASLPSTFDVKAPETSEPWELQEYQWFSAEELAELDATGKLHPALGGGNLASMVGFEEETDLHSEILSLMNQPDNLAEPKYDISNWKKVGGSQGGSNPGGVYEDELGNKFYVKESNGGEKPTHNEVVAAALYKAAGVNSNEVFLVEKNGTTMLASPWVENDGKKVPSMLNGEMDQEFLKKAQADFAIDAWLDNYDVVGIGPWNLVADADGNPFRIDPGGAMMYRATGAEKSWWSDDPTAIDDMRLGSSKSSAYTYLPNIFGNMSQADIKESAKKLLNIDEKQIAQIVQSSGLDEDTKDKLTQTLITRRQKILERYDLVPTQAKTTTDTYVSKNGLDITPDVANMVLQGKNEEAIQTFKVMHMLSKENAKMELFDFAMDAINGKAHIEQYLKVEPKEKAPFKKGEDVFVKGTGQGFKVELANNEATAGLIDGKFVVFLNEELTSDPFSGVASEANYAFTSDNGVFYKGEMAQMPDPKNHAATIDALVVTADWSSGLVTVTYTSGDGAKITQVDKTHIKKKDSGAKAVRQPIMPSDFKPAPEGSKPIAWYQHNEESDPVFIIQLPNGTTQVHNNQGDSWSGSHFSTYEDMIQNDQDQKQWHTWDGQLVDFNAPAKTSVEPEAVDGPKDLMGNPLAVGDSIVITKYNKGGFSDKAKIVSFNTEKGTAKLRRLDEAGYPLSDENGKPVYATVSLSSLRKDQMVANPNGLPTGITYSQGDESSPLFGKPAPQAPAPLAGPGEASSEPLVPGEWLIKAEAVYAAYREKKNLAPKALKDSSTAWNPIDKAMRGDEASLAVIKSKGYLDGDPALYEELAQAHAAQKAKYADLISAHEAAVKQFHRDKAAWVAANGVASYTPLKHSDVPGLSKYEAQEWASKVIGPNWKKVSNKKGFGSQKVSSGWQTAIRLLPAMLGLRREDVAKHANTSDMQVWDNIKEGAEQAGPVGEAWRGVRAVSMDRFVKNDGKRFTDGEDLKQMIGSIQKDHGAMEFSPGSWDKGAHSGYDYLDVEVDLVVPPEIKGIYTENTGLSNSDGGENGFIAEPGLAMYIWDVFQDPNQTKGPPGGRWVVKASLIPREVLPYMNNFEGDPAGHNIYIPGKDTTTGIKYTNVVPETPKLEPVQGEEKTLKIDDLQAQPIGTVMQEISNGGNVANTWTKTGEDEWTSSKGDNLTAFDLSGFNFKVTQVPTSTENILPEPGAGKWTKPLLDAAPIGKIVTDSNNTLWVKIDDDLWENNSSGESMESGQLVKDAMDDPWMELMNEPLLDPEPEALPYKKWSLGELDDFTIGTVITTANGNQWTKTGIDEWTRTKVTNDFVSTGFTVTSNTLTAYLN